jgi:hypothetical protein
MIRDNGTIQRYVRVFCSKVLDQSSILHTYVHRLMIPLSILLCLGPILRSRVMYNAGVLEIYRANNSIVRFYKLKLFSLPTVKTLQPTM